MGAPIDVNMYVGCMKFQFKQEQGYLGGTNFQSKRLNVIIIINWIVW